MSSRETTNIDVVFYAVDYLDIPTGLSGIAFVEPTSDEVSEIERRHGPTGPFTSIFCLASEGKRSFVVALTYKVLENKLHIFDSILNYENDDRPLEEFGQVLARAPKREVSQPAV